MRNKFLGFATASIFLLTASASNATTFSWSFTDGGTITGSGTFEATQDLIADASGATYQIQSVTGTMLNQTILNQLTGYGTADNLIYWQPGAPASFDPLNPYYHADYYGVGFALANGQFYALYEEAGTQPTGWTCGGANVPYCLLGPNTDGSYNGFGDHVVALTDFAVSNISETPLPATFPLFASGLGAMGLLGWRRKRKAAALAA